MVKSTKTIVREIIDSMDQIVGEDNDIDFVALLDFDEKTSRGDVVRISSRLTKSGREVDKEELTEIALLKRRYFKLRPFDDDQIDPSPKGHLRFWRVGIDDIVVVFASAPGGDLEVIRESVRKWKPKLKTQLEELSGASG